MWKRVSACVCEDKHLDVFFRPGVEHGCDVASVMDGDEESSVNSSSFVRLGINNLQSQNLRLTDGENSDYATSAKWTLHTCLSPGPPEGQAVLLTGQAHGGGVHDGHELLDVRGQHAIEELFVPVLQRHQQDVPEGETEWWLHTEARRRQTWADAAARHGSAVLATFTLTGGSRQQLHSSHVWVCSLTCPGDCCGFRNFSSHAALAHPARGSRAAAGRGCPAADAPPAWRPSPAGWESRRYTTPWFRHSLKHTQRAPNQRSESAFSTGRPQLWGARMQCTDLFYHLLFVF